MITEDISVLTQHSRSRFDDLYVNVMGQMWSHPRNEQRPVILRWLDKLHEKFPAVVDIGPGDAYYLKRLAPRRYTFAEPNAHLYQTALARARTHNIECRSFPNIRALIGNNGLETFDLALMVHVLLYLELDEIETLLPKFVGKPLFLVYPWPALSVTVQFENLLGLDTSFQRISLMRQLLGRPSRQSVVRGHFYMPHSADIDSIAFLVSHCAQSGEYDVTKMNLARKFVMENLNKWRQPAGYKIPQGQVLEVYNLSQLCT